MPPPSLLMLQKARTRHDSGSGGLDSSLTPVWPCWLAQVPHRCAALLPLLCPSWPRPWGLALC